MNIKRVPVYIEHGQATIAFLHNTLTVSHAHMYTTPTHTHTHTYTDTS